MLNTAKDLLDHEINSPLFDLGCVVMTRGIADLVDQYKIDAFKFAVRHVWGDFGDLCNEDIDENKRAISEGGRVFSSYSFNLGYTCLKIYVITEADRSRTTVLLSSEY